MRKAIKTLAVTSTLVAGLAATSALYAHDSERSGGSMMGPGMMGQGGMMGMMDMMGQMREMMETCNEMMQSMNHSGSGKPNGQWRQDAPRAPEKDG